MAFLLEIVKKILVKRHFEDGVDMTMDYLTKIVIGIVLKEAGGAMKVFLASMKSVVLVLSLTISLMALDLINNAKKDQFHFCFLRLTKLIINFKWFPLALDDMSSTNVMYCTLMHKCHVSHFDAQMSCIAF